MSQRKTILITGTSSGIGRATAFHFQRKGWQVIATMRSPEHETELNRLPGVICLGLDVNDDASIRMAVSEAIARAGRIDVLLKVPVVHRTGGLADTVVEATPRTLKTGTATGVVFNDADAGGVVWGITRGIELLRDESAQRTLIHAGMSRDFSWRTAARQYLDLYRGR